MEGWGNPVSITLWRHCRLVEPEEENMFTPKLASSMGLISIFRPEILLTPIMTDLRLLSPLIALPSRGQHSYGIT